MNDCWHVYYKIKGGECVVLDPMLVIYSIAAVVFLLVIVFIIALIVIRVTDVSDLLQETKTMLGENITVRSPMREEKEEKKHDI